MAVPLAPIWKDRIVTLDTGVDYADFEIRLNSASGTVIYFGRSYRKPGGTGIKARINDVCSAFLRTHAPEMQPFVNFYTLVGGVTKDAVCFIGDWSYDYGYTPTAGKLLNDPVLMEVDPRQLILASVYPKSGGNPVTASFSGATPVSQTVYDAYDFDDETGDNAASGAGGTIVIDMTNHSAATSVALAAGGDTLTFQVRKNACGRWCIHYVNAFGGWDWLLLDGTANFREGLEHHVALVDHSNELRSARGRKDYAIDVTPSWTLRTGYLTTDQSSRMHHLLTSPEAYLQDLADGAMIPVILTDAEAERQTYKGNGRQLCQYTFTAQLAQEFVRR